MHGFLCIDKPAGITSHDVVSRVRRISKIRRIGHAGTLDPAATGVLVLALGPTTRLIEYVQDDTRKAYRAVIRLGSATNTDDAEGTEIANAPIPSFDAVQLVGILSMFTGTIDQVPPAFSALHVDGQRMYDLARRGIAPALPARPVVVYSIDVESFDAVSITINVVCGKGTYIRSLARDIGFALGTVAHLSQLRRTAVGTFDIEHSTPLDALSADMLPQLMLPNRRALADWPIHQATVAEIARLTNGLPIIAPHPIASRVAILDKTGELVATALQRDAQQLFPTKVFRWSDAS